MINFAADFIKNSIMAGYLVEDTRKVTTHRLIEMKQQGKKIAMLTSYDYTMARIVDGAGVDVILIGDSASNVMAGNTTTLPITLNIPCDFGDARCGTGIGRMRHAFRFLSGQSHGRSDQCHPYYEGKRLRRSETGRRGGNYRHGEGYIGSRYSRYGTFGADTAEYQ